MFSEAEFSLFFGLFSIDEYVGYIVFGVLCPFKVIIRFFLSAYFVPVRA